MIARPSFHPSSINASISNSALSESFRPSGPNNFIPLSEKPLCEAVIITPRSALNLVVIKATPGVGIGPVSLTSIPTEANPATRAGSII